MATSIFSGKDFIHVTQLKCPRCERVHANMPFIALTNVGDFSHYSTCPDTLEPVLLITTLCTLGVCGMDRNHSHEHTPEEIANAHPTEWPKLGFVVEGSITEGTKLVLRRIAEHARQ